MSSPLVIGGTGGSGTRVLARILRLGGRYMGVDRNDSEDAMLFAGFDWAWGLFYLQRGSTPAMAREFEETIAKHLAGRPDRVPWGWKHPHSYLLLPFLHERFPDMRFIHVVRDGRDIALSHNQQQAHRYGGLLQRPEEPKPVRSAAWWAWANVRAQRTGESLGGNYLLVRFEDLCADPLASTRRIVAFSGGGEEALAAEVASPRSLGRWRHHDHVLMREIEAACGEALRRFGYN